MRTSTLWAPRQPPVRWALRCSGKASLQLLRCRPLGRIWPSPGGPFKHNPWEGSCCTSPAPWGNPEMGPFPAGAARRAGPEQDSLGAQPAAQFHLPSLPPSLPETRKIGPLPSLPSWGSSARSSMWLVEELLWGALRKPPHPWPQGLGLAGPTLLIPDLSSTRSPAQETPEDPPRW